MESEFFKEIREEMERSYRPREAGSGRLEPASGETSSLEQAGMQFALAALQGSYALVGQLPPEPPTWRGRAGTKAVKLIQRMLFWYTPQIVRFQYSALRAFEEQAKALDMAHQRIRELQRRQDEACESLAALQEELRALRSRDADYPGPSAR